MKNKTAKQACAKLARAKTQLANSRKPIVRAADQARRIKKIGVDCVIEGWTRSGIGGTPSARNAMLKAYGLL